MLAWPTWGMKWTPMQQGVAGTQELAAEAASRPPPSFATTAAVWGQETEAAIVQKADTVPCSHGPGMHFMQGP